MHLYRINGDFIERYDIVPNFKKIQKYRAENFDNNVKLYQIRTTIPETLHELTMQKHFIPFNVLNIKRGVSSYSKFGPINNPSSKQRLQITKYRSEFIEGKYDFMHVKRIKPFNEKLTIEFLIIPFAKKSCNCSNKKAFTDPIFVISRNFYFLELLIAGKITEASKYSIIPDELFSLFIIQKSSRINITTANNITDNIIMGIKKQEHITEKIIKFATYIKQNKS